MMNRLGLRMASGLPRLLAIRSVGTPTVVMRQFSVLRTATTACRALPIRSTTRPLSTDSKATPATGSTASTAGATSNPSASASTGTGAGAGAAGATSKPAASASAGGLLGRLQSTLFENRDRLRTYLVAATAFGGAVLILKAGIWLVEFFADINFADVGEWAYVAGVVSGLALVGVFVAGKRLVTIRPEPVYRMTLKSVCANPKVALRLGESLAPGKFRAYSVIEGGLRLTSDGKKYDGWQRWWKPKRIQILFSLTGSRGTGMISAEVQNDYRGKPFYRLLALDVMDGKAEHVVLDGDPTYRVDHGPIKLG